MNGVSCAPSCPSDLRNAADGFKDLLGPHYKSFVAALCGYFFGLSSFSDIVRYLMFSPSVTDLCRLFNEKNLSGRLNKRQRCIVQKIMKKSGKGKSRYIWALDDTLLPHYGKKIWGAYWWYDHCLKSNVFGHKLLVLGVVDTVKNIFIPVKWEILHRTDDKKIQDHEKGWVVGLRLLREAIDEKFPDLPFVADSWFACEEAFIELDKMGIGFVMEVKNNRIVSLHGREKIGINVKKFFQDFKRTKIYFMKKARWACSVVLRFKDSKIRLKTVAVANQKGLTTDPFSYYVSNKLTWDENKIWGLARYRWAIEVQFRELKQHFALGEAAVRSKQAVETSISISMIALTVVRQFQLENADANKNQHVRPIPASTIVSNFKLNSFNVLISKLASPGEVVLFKKFRARLKKKNFNSKPTLDLYNLEVPNDALAG
jgi:hypothetical protein